MKEPSLDSEGLAAYVRECRSNGYADAQIAEALLDRGAIIPCAISP